MTEANTAKAVIRDGVIKTSIFFPRPVWKQVKIAAIDHGKSAGQFVVDTMTRKVTKKKG